MSNARIVEKIGINFDNIKVTESGLYASMGYRDRQTGEVIYEPICIMPKYVFIEAYNKYIKGEKNND